MKKTTIVILSLLVATTSLFGWSKKVQNSGNLGRTYIGIGAAADFARGKVASGHSDNAMGGSAKVLFNIPVFKPNVNVLKGVSWFGMDMTPFVSYGYTTFPSVISPVLGDHGQTLQVGTSVTPYLNFETGLEYLVAIKPFIIGTAAYQHNWADTSVVSNFDDSAFAYGFGGGVEFVITNKLSLTPIWKWRSNTASHAEDIQTLGVDLSFWASDQIGVSLFFEHDIRFKRDGYEQSNNKVGVMLKIGFPR